MFSPALQERDNTWIIVEKLCSARSVKIIMPLEKVLKISEIRSSVIRKLLLYMRLNIEKEKKAYVCRRL